MAETSILGIRVTTDWVKNESRPTNWREGILDQFPNEAFLTALTAGMKKRRLIDDPQFSWHTQKVPTYEVAVTGIYTNTGLSTAYVSGGAIGTSLYVKLAEADAKRFVTGDVVYFRIPNAPSAQVAARCFAESVLAGASSYLSVKLLEADDNGASVSKDISDATKIIRGGSAYAEGAEVANARSFEPVKGENFTQIFRTPIYASRTALQTRFRTEEARKKLKRDALREHARQLEEAFLRGVALETTDPTSGKPLRTTAGLLSFLRAETALADFRHDATYSGDTWLTSGEEWFDANLEEVFRYSNSKVKVGLIGSEALLGLNKLIKARGYYGFTPTTDSYGIKVLEWITPFGTIYLKPHGLLSHNPSDRKTLMVFEPEELSFNYIQDTMYKADDYKASRNNLRDGINEEFLTEAGLEYHGLVGAKVFDNVGADNAV